MKVQKYHKDITRFRDTNSSLLSYLRFQFCFLFFLLGLLQFLSFPPLTTVMESSQLFGDAEECCSSESGWTMYIASPLHHDDAQDDNGEDDEDYDNDDNGKDGNDDSDDSMASDASTGPNHGEGEQPYESGGKGSHGMTDFKDDEKSYSYTKAYRQKVKKVEEKGTDAEKQGSVLVASSASSATSPSPVHSGVKVRKTRKIEKGK